MAVNPMERDKTILPLVLDAISYEVGGERLIDTISAQFTAGQRTILLGANGAGKSVTLRLCHGLIQPTAGRVQWRGGAAADATRRQAMVFQRPVMLRRSAAANVSYALALRGVHGRERRDRTEEALDQMGLLRFARRPARVLSGGEQQRLALARAWALRPEVLFLDEPTANLDPSATQAIEISIHKIFAAGTKIIMTTHDLGQARRLADEVVFLHGGRLVERSAATKFFESPQSPEARAFIEGRLWADSIRED